MTTSTVIIGAGVIGLSLAIRLQEAGHRVVVVEQGDSPSGASLANAGWVETRTLQPLSSPDSLRFGAMSLLRPGSALRIRPRPSLALAGWLMEFARSSTAAHWSDGRDALMALAQGNGPELIRTAERLGATVNAVESLSVYDDVEAARAAVEKLRIGGLPGVTVLGRDEVLALEPGLSPLAGGGLLIEGDVQIEPASLMRALERGVVASGGEVRRGSRVTGFRRTRGRVEAVETSSGAIPADQIVIAAGFASSALASALGTRLRLEAGKGYSVSVRLPFRPGRVVNFASAKVGLVPTVDGSRLVGTMEFAGPDGRIGERQVRGIAAAARPYIRAFEEAEQSFVDPSRITVGLRPMSASGLPIIDRLPGTANAFVSTGHSMMGVSLALPSADALTEYIGTGRRPPVLDAFRIRPTQREGNEEPQ